MDNKTQASPVPNPDTDDQTVEDDESVLDLTSCHFRSLASVELPLSLTELDLTANRLSSLDPRIGQLSNLTKLSLRQNLFDDNAVEPISRYDALSALEELVLRDNKLTTIPDVSIFKKLLVFDVSFNEITSLHGLSKVTNTLKELYVSNNEVTKTEEIDHFHDLQILELGSNRLRVMENMQNFKSLQELWLGRNRIKAVNLCGLKCIKKISLQSNRLTSMTGFEECIALEELYLSHNGIAKMEGLSSLVNLRVLDVSSNKLTSVNDIQNLTLLEDLWLNDNKIESLEALPRLLLVPKRSLLLSTLKTIHVRNLPIILLLLDRAFQTSNKSIPLYLLESFVAPDFVSTVVCVHKSGFQVLCSSGDCLRDKAGVLEEHTSYKELHIDQERDIQDSYLLTGYKAFKTLSANVS